MDVGNRLCIGRLGCMGREWYHGVFGVGLDCL
jgi:hypothetical protein